MVVFVFTRRESAIKTIFGKGAVFFSELTQDRKPGIGDISYVDVSEFPADDVRIAVRAIKKHCKASAWGIIDPNGIVKDTAALFFDGASDYIGPDFFKSSTVIEQKRLKLAAQWRSEVSGSAGEAPKAEAEHAKKLSLLPQSGIKLPPASLFPGWENIKAGKIMPFYLLYCAVRGETALSTKLGERNYVQLQQRFLAYLSQNFQSADGLVWMDSGRDFLFLMPPKAEVGKTIVKACVRMLVDTPLTAIETFDLGIPVKFVFALHYGETGYSPPGKTGTVVSEAVNFIFHLGHKRAEAGRLTVSGGLPDVSFPRELEDCFVPAGEYEGRKIWHTKKFSYGRL